MGIYIESVEESLADLHDSIFGEIFQPILNYVKNYVFCDCYVDAVERLNVLSDLFFEVEYNEDLLSKKRLSLIDGPLYFKVPAIDGDGAVEPLSNSTDANFVLDPEFLEGFYVLCGNLTVEEFEELVRFLESYTIYFFNIYFRNNRLAGYLFLCFGIEDVFNIDNDELARRLRALQVGI